MNTVVGSWNELDGDWINEDANMLSSWLEKHETYMCQAALEYGDQIIVGTLVITLMPNHRWTAVMGSAVGAGEDLILTEDGDWDWDTDAAWFNSPMDAFDAALATGELKIAVN